MYLLENTKLKSSGAVIYFSTTNTELLANFMAERYLLDIDGDDIYFYSIDMKMGGMIGSFVSGGNSYILVSYSNFSSIATVKATSKIANDIIREDFESLKPNLQGSVK